MATTTKGALCPVCQQNQTTHVALTVYQDMRPHTYAVCASCYCDQWKQSGEEGPCPLEDVPVTPFEGERATDE